MAGTTTVRLGAATVAGVTLLGCLGVAVPAARAQQQQPAPPSVELQSSTPGTPAPVRRQSLEPQPRSGTGTGAAVELGEPGGETKTPGGAGGPNAGGIPVAPPAPGR